MPIPNTKNVNKSLPRELILNFLVQIVVLLIDNVIELCRTKQFFEKSLYALHRNDSSSNVYTKFSIVAKSANI